MSFASDSMRFVSRPAFFRDVGEQVDSARTVISSPEPTRSTGSPAASYHPQATVFGVGSSENDFPAAGAGQSLRGAASAHVDGEGDAPVAATDDGVRQPSASTPLIATPTI